MRRWSMAYWWGEVDSDDDSLLAHETTITSQGTTIRPRFMLYQRRYWNAGSSRDPSTLGVRRSTWGLTSDEQWLG